MSTRNRTLAVRNIVRKVLASLIIPTVTRTYSEPLKDGRLRIKVWMLKTPGGRTTALDLQIKSMLTNAGVEYDWAGWSTYYAHNYRPGTVTSYVVYI